MDEARRVLERLERIEHLDRKATPAAEVLTELRALLHEAEAWTRAERADTTEAESALVSLRRTLVA